LDFIFGVITSNFLIFINDLIKGNRNTTA